MKTNYFTADELLELYPELVEKFNFTKARLATYYHTFAITGELNSSQNKIYYDVNSVIDFVHYVNRQIAARTVDTTQWKKRTI